MGLIHEFIATLATIGVDSSPTGENDDGLWHDDAYFADDDGLWHDDIYFDDDDGLWHDDIYF